MLSTIVYDSHTLFSSRIHPLFMSLVSAQINFNGGKLLVEFLCKFNSIELIYSEYKEGRNTVVVLNNCHALLYCTKTQQGAYLH